MNRNFNLPDGVTQYDICGKPMPVCEKCGVEHNESEELCATCREEIKREELESD